MTLFEPIKPIKLSADNDITPRKEPLPELVHLHDAAKSIYIDYRHTLPTTVSPRTTIDEAIHEMRSHHQQILLVVEAGKVIGLINTEDLIGEKPLQLMHTKRLSRKEITIDLLMVPCEDILALNINHLKAAQVGHIIATIKKYSADYLLVVKPLKNGRHIIKGLFLTSQISRQLHADLSSILTQTPTSIADLHRERKWMKR